MFLAERKLPGSRGATVGLKDKLSAAGLGQAAAAADSVQGPKRIVHVGADIDDRFRPAEGQVG